VNMPATPSTRLSVLLARDAPIGVVFRRGPSRSVLLVRWRTDTDTFEEGQWLRGRIYENRCDLSPSGQRLIYFAASWKKPYQSWTAVSKPPWLTALLLWPKGDAWGGGGHFQGESTIALNHRPEQRTLAEGRALPRKVRVVDLGQHPGRGEDHPVWGLRLLRDGWRFLQDGTEHERKLGAPIWIEWDPPIVWGKTIARHPDLELRMLIRGLHEKNGPWYVLEHTLARRDGRVVTLGRTDWADFDHTGRLVFARDGRLYALSGAALARLEIDRAAELADFRDRRFVARASPKAAREWR